MESARPRVALVTCAAYPDLHEDDLLLARALERLGISAIPAVWSDAAIDWASFDALVIRTPWDYFERAAEFRAWLDARIAGGVLMCNAGDILRRRLSYLPSASGPGPAITGYSSSSAAPLKASRSSRPWWRRHEPVSWRHGPE